MILFFGCQLLGGLDFVYSQGAMDFILLLGWRN